MEDRGPCMTLPLACFWIYYVSCACVIESCACQLYIKRIYDDDDAMLRGHKSVHSKRYLTSFKNFTRVHDCDRRTDEQTVTSVTIVVIAANAVSDAA